MAQGLSCLGVKVVAVRAKGAEARLIGGLIELIELIHFKLLEGYSGAIRSVILSEKLRLARTLTRTRTGAEKGL